jgi:hypothetical protein
VIAIGYALAGFTDVKVVADTGKAIDIGTRKAGDIE